VAFFTARGKNEKELLNASPIEKIFYNNVKENYWREKAEFLSVMFDGKEK